MWTVNALNHGACRVTWLRECACALPSCVNVWPFVVTFRLRSVRGRGVPCETKVSRVEALDPSSQRAS